MKKSALIILAVLMILILSLVLVVAEDTNTSATTETEKVDKAYSCLKNTTYEKNQCNDLTIEEQAFSLLALSYDSNMRDKCKSALLDKSKDQECWPKDSCRIKETALAVLALNSINADTEKSRAWLLSQNKSADLIWFMQIDTNEESKCTIKYRTSQYETTVKADKKLSGDAGTCLSRARDNYWIEINSACLNEEFTISCNKDFKTALSYKKQDSSTIYVSSITHSASSDATTTEKVNAYCFKQGSGCDYEGSLWATLALYKKGQNINIFLPYLVAFAESNKKYLPESFLYILTSDDTYFQTLSSSTKESGKYWQESTDKYYDTAVAMLSLKSSSADTSRVIAWLLEVQGKDGCWPSTRNTAFLLYAIWPKTPSGGGGAADITYCKDAKYFCITRDECVEAGGNSLANYACVETGAVCCDKATTIKTCSSQGGKFCSEKETCDGFTLVASDTTSGKICCKGECEAVVEYDCEKTSSDYFCKTTCGENEESKLGFTCPGEGICCGPKTQTTSYWWIWLLIILIILIILAIIFRNKLRNLLSQVKSKPSQKPGTSGIMQPRYPPFPPRMMSRQILPTRTMPPARPTQARKPITKTDHELEETLKKLKEMSK